MSGGGGEVAGLGNRSGVRSIDSSSSRVAIIAAVAARVRSAVVCSRVGSPLDHDARYGHRVLAGVDADGGAQHVGDRFGFDLLEVAAPGEGVLVVEGDVRPFVEQGLQRGGWFEVVADGDVAGDEVGAPVPRLDR